MKDLCVINLPGRRKEAAESAAVHVYFRYIYYTDTFFCKMKLSIAAILGDNASHRRSMGFQFFGNCFSIVYPSTCLWLFSSPRSRVFQFLRNLLSMFQYSFQIDCCQHIDQMSEAFGFSAVQGPKDMVGSGGPTCPNCPHGRALTSLRTAERVRNWEVAWLQDNKRITSRPTLQKWLALQLNKSMNF